MASLLACQAVASVAASPRASVSTTASKSQLFAPLRLQECASRGPKVVCAVGDVSAEGTKYLIVGAIAIALVGTALPVLFSRKDLCPECDGAGFVRKTGSALNANAARKDQAQIVCPNCNGLGKINQTDKAVQAAPKAKAKRR